MKNVNQIDLDLDVVCWWMMDFLVDLFLRDWNRDSKFNDTSKSKWSNSRTVTNEKRRRVLKRRSDENRARKTARKKDQTARRENWLKKLILDWSSRVWWWKQVEYVTTIFLTPSPPWELASSHTHTDLEHRLTRSYSQLVSISAISTKTTVPKYQSYRE